MDLNTAWYLLITVLIIGYAILDGFDLGTGILYLFFRKKEERSLFRRSVVVFASLMIRLSSVVFFESNVGV